MCCLEPDFPKITFSQEPSALSMLCSFLALAQGTPLRPCKRFVSRRLIRAPDQGMVHASPISFTTNLRPASCDSLLGRDAFFNPARALVDPIDL
jgi:hypothetical protein